MNDMPLISVIIPVYKVAEEYLRECIDSVIAQTLKEIEIILVDDGSPDNCGALCDEYAERDSRIRVVHKENGGVSSARNTGVELAKGEYIQFVDADDYIDESMCETLLNAALQHRTDLVVCGYVRVFRNSAETMLTDDYMVCNDLYDFEKHFVVMLNNGLFNVPWNKLYKREYCGEFDSGIHMGEDIVFNLDYLSSHKSVAIINKALYFYRYADASACNSYRENALDEEFFLVHKILDFCNENFPQSTNKGEYFFVLIEHIKSAFYRMAQGKNVISDIRKGMRRNEYAQILNYPGLKLDKLYDKLYVFLMKRRLALMFAFCLRAEMFLIKYTPKIASFARKLYKKKKL